MRIDLNCMFCLEQETRRRQLAEAADRRMAENQKKGIKDPEALKRKQKRQEEMEKRADTQSGGEGGLRVNVLMFHKWLSSVKHIICERRTQL